jgi:RES domain-containing protein
MILWRISRHRDLSGAGELRAPGRWHYSGQPIVYLAESPAAALLEVCVHTCANDVPPDFTLLSIEGPDLKVQSVRVHDLPSAWREQMDITREIGTSWLAKGASVLLRVPSALVPETANLLFNPRHADATKFRVTRTFSYPFDTRLKS